MTSDHYHHSAVFRNSYSTTTMVCWIAASAGTCKP